MTAADDIMAIVQTHADTYGDFAERLANAEGVPEEAVRELQVASRLMAQAVEPTIQEIKSLAVAAREHSGADADPAESYRVARSLALTVKDKSQALLERFANFELAVTHALSSPYIWYLQDSRDTADGRVLFWRMNARGYTKFLPEAECFKHQEAVERSRDRKTDVMWGGPTLVAVAGVDETVTPEALDRIRAAAAVGPNEESSHEQNKQAAE